MKGIKIILWVLWRIWFYILMAIPIIVFLPILILTILSEKGYPYFFRIARIWAKFILYGMGFYYKIESEQIIEPNKSYMIVANHTSMTDIMLMLATIKNPFVFVGKQELAKIPIFGFFYKRTCILVDRKDSQSRMAVFTKAHKRIERGLSVCIFPEGGVPDDESIILDHFKEGAFKLAIQHQIPILPITFGDNKERFPYTYFVGTPGLMRVKIHRIVETSGKTETDRKELREGVKNTIYNQLLIFKANKKLRTIS
jgi:1-acyl-sn-glycerol-3-phosphate acyltransferase